MDFVERLKTLRKESNLTQQEVADRLFISRSLYAKYESGLATPNKDILQKMALLFDVKIDSLVSSEETVFMVVEEQNTRERLKKFTLIFIAVICGLFVVLYFIPMLPVYRYQYPHPHGEPPERVMTIMSSCVLLNSLSNPIGNITLVGCVCELTLSILCLTVFSKKRIIIRYICYVSFAIVIFLIFFAVVYSLGFSY